MAPNEPQPARNPQDDPAHRAPSDTQPNPGDPGPELPDPHPTVDPLREPRMPLDEPQETGV
jgi:hypothetical protein